MDGYTIGPAVDFDPFAKPKKTGQKYTLGARLTSTRLQMTIQPPRCPTS
jgi:hypothetical protein